MQILFTDKLTQHLHVMVLIIQETIIYEMMAILIQLLNQIDLNFEFIYMEKQKVLVYLHKYNNDENFD